MKDFIKFLSENWRLLLEAALVIFSTILFILKKKPVKVLDTLKEIIIRVLPVLINLAEIQSGLSGEDKKAFVVQQLFQKLKELGYGDDIVTPYLPFIDEQIELILTTPQKKVR